MMRPLTRFVGRDITLSFVIVTYNATDGSIEAHIFLQIVLLVEVHKVGLDLLARREEGGPVGVGLEGVAVDVGGNVTARTVLVLAARERTKRRGEIREPYAQPGYRFSNQVPPMVAFFS
jgi:hypothetical protein